MGKTMTVAKPSITQRLEEFVERFVLRRFVSLLSASISHLSLLLFLVEHEYFYYFAYIYIKVYSSLSMIFQSF